MLTERRLGGKNEYESRQPAAGAPSDWLAGLMFCYNMPEPASQDCAEPEAWSADQAYADALMGCYNE